MTEPSPRPPVPGRAAPVPGPSAAGPHDGHRHDPEVRRGTLLGLLAYGLWGVFPVYFLLVKRATAWEILGQRILWTLLLCAVAMTVLRQWSSLRALRGWRGSLLAVGASAFITTNWTLYTIGVTSGRVTETSLGYYLNPLATVLLGVVLLRERLRALQWVAIGLGGVAAAYLLLRQDDVPWISFGLAASFSLYSLIKNRLGSRLGAWASLTVETLVAAPVAVALLVWLGATGRETFTRLGPGHAGLLVLSGVITALPLLLFAAAARRVPLVTIGLMQFIAPSLQLLMAVLLFGEHVSAARWVGFALVWAALVVLATDMVRQARWRPARAEAGTAD